MVWNHTVGPFACAREVREVRCTCMKCGTYMVHAEDMELGCICPECQNRCKACLGTGGPLSVEQIRALGAGYFGYEEKEKGER